MDRDLMSTPPRPAPAWPDPDEVPSDLDVEPVRLDRGLRDHRATARGILALGLAFALGSGVTLAAMGGARPAGSEGSASPGVTTEAATPPTGSTEGRAAAAGVASAAAAITVTDAAQAAALDRLDPDGLVDTIAGIHASVVTITAEIESSFGRRSGIFTSTGSGVIVRPNGTILTNAHVVDGARGIVVTLEDGSELAAEVLRADTDADLAIIKVDARRLPAVTIGDSDGLQVGQTAIAIGNPLGRFAGTVTVGVISGLGRSIDVREGFSELRLRGLIQTDAAINTGNSGGALFDGDGRLIGITTAVTADAQGLAFAIPIGDAARILAAAGVNAG
jgi:S1-C subfamily serine protease